MKIQVNFRQNLINSNLNHFNNLALKPKIYHHSKLSTLNNQLNDLKKKSNGIDQEEDDDLLSDLTKRRGGRIKKGNQKINVDDWLKSQDGLKFKDPKIGRTNWIGDQIPFPSNPWFKPQPPLSDEIRTRVYESFKRRVTSFQSNSNNSLNISSHEKKRHEQLLIRQTSEQWCIPPDRISAIIRLKAMEDSWTLNDQSNSNTKSSPAKTLQMNFEKGMENLLGVQKDRVNQINEDINELINRRMKRKSRFYGIEFVPLDSPSTDVLTPSSSNAENQKSPSSKRYQDADEPSEIRHIIGPDGLPRPPACYVANPPGKVPMVFTDVSEFPRLPKPMSKRKAKYHPKTSLLPNYSTELHQPTRTMSSRRSNSTLAAIAVRQSQDSTLSDRIGGRTSEKTPSKAKEGKQELAAQLLRQFKGCANSNNGLKLLEEFKSVKTNKLASQTEIDSDEIKERVLLQAGGLSFRKPGAKAASEYNETNETSTENLSDEEKQIRSIRYEMIKSIYLKKLELNSAGRLLLPKSIRTKEEQDYQILSSHSPHEIVETKGSTSQRNRQSQLTNRSNSLIKQCMKGPRGRIKERQLLNKSKETL
ncbi:hypothetical protein O181_015748 [Austropuccinia psidii MF-1]|uniref:Uncharacterized protein n=1 Tax=Austropuccinia psidii MF-1 TaxID=1389203 RepID=A0A9Q3GQ91_9BASI|nr:hypothetical protein [Austropuccinia psidii MF-1]